MKDKIRSRSWFYLCRLISRLCFGIENDSGKSISSSAKISMVIPTSRAYLSKTGRGGSLVSNSYFEISVRRKLNSPVDNLSAISARLQSEWLRIDFSFSPKRLGLIRFRLPIRIILPTKSAELA